tara:strand:- start:104 stop:3004 length:2901 start_codon:yes stop_codon:yes gene_type:complete
MDILQFWKQDTNTSKPKIIIKGGFYTKKFLQYNKTHLYKGEVNNFIDTNFIYNPATKRLIKKKYDKRYKVKVLTKGFIKKYPNIKNNVVDYGIKLRHTFQGGEKENIIKSLLGNITGNVKFIFQLDNKILKEFNVLIEGSVNKFWKKNFELFTITYEPLVWIWNVGGDVNMIITKETKLKKTTMNQLFKDGANYYCFYSVILDYFNEKIENTKSKSFKSKCKEKINYIQGKQLKTHYKYGILQKYKGGMPDSKNVLSILSNKLEVGFDIEMPFQKETFLKIRPLKPVKKVFRYVNSRLNHLETIENNGWFNNLYNNDFKQVEYVDRETLYNIVEDCKKNDIMCIYNKDNCGINKVKTTKKFFSLSNSFYDTINEFEKEVGFTANMKIDYNLDKNLSEFIIQSSHYNGTIDFKDLSKVNSQDSDIKQIDMKKAYSQFYNCKYYNGFMGVITNSIRPMTSYKDLKGCFYITDLFIPEGKLKKLNKAMNIYFSNNIYYDTELKFLEDNGCKFKVVYGVVGEMFDFRFNNDMLNKKEETLLGDRKIKVPYYSKWSGQKGMIYPNKNFYMKGSKNYFENLRGEHDIYNDNVSDEYRVSYPKKSVNHALHITAQITTYQRLGMLEQLLNMDLDKILRVCVDGIYYKEHKFKPCEKVQFDYNKEKKAFNLWSESDSFINNVYDNLEETEWKCENIKRPYNKVEVHLGMGGAGKTHYNLEDKGLYNSCFVAPSWFLSCDKKEDYNLKNNTVVARLTDKSLPYWKEIMEKFNNLIIDECSMINEEQKTFIIDNFKGGIYFCGDIGYQLPPVHNKEMSLDGMKVIEHKKNYRCKDTEFLNILLEVRKSIKEGKDDCKKVINQFNSITFEEVKKIYKVKDMIITSQNNFIDEINKDIDLEKYLVKNNTSLYKNGQILFKNPNKVGVDTIKTNAFTIHKVQGKTAEESLFIDKRKIKSLRMLYTALSRVRVKKQICFF